MRLAEHASRAAVRSFVRPSDRARVARAPFRDAGHGYDRLGLTLDAVALSLTATRFLYETWFRVDSRGAEHIPRSGPAILVANHSGLLPLDGAMLWADVLRHGDPPRIPRTVADTFVPRLPFVYTSLSRCGVIAGNRATVDRVLRDGELITIFPEGVPGIAKPRSERYRLRPFRVGHAELAIRHRAPIVPVAIVGAEEQWPELARIESFHAFGAPYLPIPATPVPLPVRYHIRYGAPIVEPGLAPEQADDPATVRALAQRAQDAVQSLVDRALSERTGIFR